MKHLMYSDLLIHSRSAASPQKCPCVIWNFPTHCRPSHRAEVVGFTIMPAHFANDADGLCPHGSAPTVAAG